MKKLLYFFIIICSIASSHTYCQNNLDQATNSILDNATKLKKKIETLQSEDSYDKPNITVEQIYRMLTAQQLTENSNIAHNKNKHTASHKNLELITTWFEQEKSIDDWINYFAIHNQTIATLQKELEGLKSCPELTKEIKKRIMTVFEQNLQTLYFNNGNPTALKSLIYVYQDYQSLFKIYEIITQASE